MDLAKFPAGSQNFAAIIFNRDPIRICQLNLLVVALTQLDGVDLLLKVFEAGLEGLFLGAELHFRVAAYGLDQQEGPALRAATAQGR